MSGVKVSTWGVMKLGLWVVFFLMSGWLEKPVIAPFATQGQQVAPQARAKLPAVKGKVHHHHGVKG